MTSQESHPKVAVDWYSGTVMYPAREVIDKFVDDVAEEVMVFETRGVMGYKYGHQISLYDEVLATVYSKGLKESDCHVVSTGQLAQYGSIFLRNYYPQHHTVSRIDLKRDYDAGKNTWKKMTDRISRELRGHVEIKYFGPDLQEPGEKGRTMYYGAKASDLTARCYEKGLELLQTGKAEPGTVSESMTRFEVQFRPQKGYKKIVALAEFEEIAKHKWAARAWSAIDKVRYLRAVLSDSIQMVSNEERSFRHLFKQYRNLIKAKQRKESWTREQLGEYLLQGFGL